MCTNTQNVFIYLVYAIFLSLLYLKKYKKQKDILCIRTH